jgi:3',5'-cyclic AMP phosphodiesterase CpdA
MTGKRLLGTANLYLLGRKSKFSTAAQKAAVSTVLAQDPDVVVFTGDLTAQALDAEFSTARDLLDPILSRFPTIMIPGNHDTYVRENTPGDRMRELFGEWMGDQMPSAEIHNGIRFVRLETCRCHPLSSGWTPANQLEELKNVLAATEADYTFLCIHYPLLDRRGDPYGPSTRALANAEEVRKLIRSTSGIDAILHGHEHHGFRTEIEGLHGPIDILNPGASGYAHLPQQDRTAHMCMYTVEDTNLVGVERFTFDGSQFAPESGGAFATGR